MLPVTQNLKESIEVSEVVPAIVMKIDGYGKVITDVKIQKYIRIGDPGLVIGDDWTIGGLSTLPDQHDYITYNTGTTSEITQTLDVSRGQGSSITSMVVSVVDKNEAVTEIVSPGFLLEEIIGREVTIYQGIKSTAYPEDYNVIFRGIVQGLGSGFGYVNFILSNTEEKKRSQTIAQLTGKLLNPITSLDTSCELVDASEFETPNDILTTYLKIDDEFLQYTGKTGNVLTGLVRGLDNTLAADHSADSDATRWCKLSDNGINIALKLMLSQGAEFYIEDMPVKGFEVFDYVDSISNAIYFEKINLETEYGAAVGDTVIVSSAIDPGNDVTSTIAEIGMIQDSTYVVLNDFIIPENPTTATASFKSQFNTMSVGLGMKPKEVDVKQHLYIRDTFIPLFTLETYVDGIDVTKDFLDQQVYLPMACFSAPRKGRSSVIYHIAPLPINEIKEISALTVKNAPALQIERSTSENFFNQVDYTFDYSPAAAEYKTAKSFPSKVSKARMPNLGDRPFLIESVGLRTESEGATIARQSAARFLRRYQFGAEFIKGIDVHFKTGYAIEIGDIVLVDFDSMQFSNYDKGYRGGGFKLMECLNMSRDQKTGEIKLDLVNTAYGVGDRFGLISPASETDVGSTTTKLRLKKSFTTRSFQRESTKWSAYIGQDVIVHTEDWSTVYATKIKGFDNQSPQGMLIETIPTAPGADWIVQAPNYPDTTNQRDLKFWKLRHAFFSPQIPVTATVMGFEQTKFTVSAPDALKFFVGSQVRVHNYGYTDDAPEAKVKSIVGNVIEIDTAAGFTIGVTHMIDLIGFPDLQSAYRVI